MSNVPDIRFKGFTDAWEQREFLEFVNKLSKTSTSENLPKIEFEDIISGEGRLNKDVSAKFDNRKGILFNENNILYGKLRPYLKNWLYTDFKGVALGDFWVFEAKNMGPKFLYFLIQADIYQKAANDTSGTKMPRSDWQKVSSTKFYIPRDLEEQIKVGNFLMEIDKTITLLQRKRTLLLETKKGLLQKLFVHTETLLPSLRFQEFHKKWRCAQLIEYLTTSTLINNDERYGKEHVLSVSGEFGIVNQIEFQGRSFAGVSVAKYGVVEFGDIVYTKSPLKANPYGIIKCNDRKTGIVSTLYAVYKPNNNVDSKFVEYYFENRLRLNSYLKPLVNKGAKNDMKVSDTNALKGDVIFPNEVEEQRKISFLLNDINLLISNLQSEIDKLNCLKKGFLQKLFPKE